MDGPIPAAQLRYADAAARLALLTHPALPVTAHAPWFVADVPVAGEPGVELAAPPALLQMVLPRLAAGGPSVTLRAPRASSLVLQQLEAGDPVLREAFTRTLWATSLRAVALLGQVRRSGWVRAPSALVERELAACYAAVLPEPRARHRVALAHRAWLQRAAAQRADPGGAGAGVEDRSAGPWQAERIPLPPPARLRSVGAGLRSCAADRCAADRCADALAELVARALHVHVVRLTGTGSAETLRREAQALLEISRQAASGHVRREMP